MIHKKEKNNCSHSPHETMLGRANIAEIYDKIRVMRRQEDGPYQFGDYLFLNDSSLREGIDKCT